MFNMLDKVKVVSGKGSSKQKTIKEGIIVALTTTGAKIYDSKQESPFTDTVTGAEWFPFESSQSQIRMVEPHKPRKKR